MNLKIDGTNCKKSIISGNQTGIIPLKSMNKREIETRKIKEITNLKSLRCL
jgi:hypothetical protein